MRKQHGSRFSVECLYKQCYLNKKIRQLANLSRHFKLQNCYLCNQTSSDLICPICTRDLPTLDSNKRDKCLLSRPDVKLAIGKCQFEHLHVPYRYHWPATTLIKDLKFARKDYLAYQLSLLLLAYVRDVYADTSLPEAIIPVPMHARRFFKRKYNQATLIANPLSDALHIPIRNDICRRIMDTKAQTGLGGQSRRRNLKNAFIAQPVPSLSHIAIVDDVITTGATVNNLAAKLKTESPHLKIDVWALAISI